MTTLSTKTYLQIVNDAIDESGSELSQFAADGSDWNTVTDAQMNRFKKWVKRAWRDIQQDANDWHWLEDTAVVTINPGIMFYSDTEISAGTADINPAIITDVDDTTKIEGLTVSRVFDLTDNTSAEIDREGYKQFGFMDLAYDDYSLTNQHALDFSLKSGGFKITRDGENKLGISLAWSAPVVNDDLGLVAVGDTLNSITIVDAQNGNVQTYSLEGAAVKSVSVGTEMCTMYITYDASVGDFWAKLFEYAAAQSVLASFNIGCNITINTSSGPVSFTCRIQWPGGASDPPTGPSGSMSPYKYDLNIDGNVTINTPLDIGNIITRASMRVSKSITDHVTYSFPCDAMISLMYASTTQGKLYLSVAEDGGVADSAWANQFAPDPVVPTGPFAFSLFTYLLFYNCPAAQAMLTNMVFFRDSEDATDYSLYPEYQFSPLPLPDSTVEVITYDGGVESTFDYSLIVPYVQNNWVHSWKSYDWEEEINANDFLYKIRSIDNKSFRIVRHEDLNSRIEAPLEFIPWSSFVNKFSFATTIPSVPRYITQDNMGRYRFYPPPDRPYTVLFDMCREAQEFTNWNDVPKGLPREYEDIIMWLAVQYFGEYDEQPSVMARGRRNYKNIVVALQQIHRPKFHFVPHRLWR